MPRVSRDATLDMALADDLSQFYADPLGHVLFSYPWEKDTSIQLVKLPEPWRTKYKSEWGPDKWACEFLDDLGAQVRDRGFDGRNAVMPIRYSFASGHGIGKSVICAWLVKWILDTRPFSIGTMTASKAEQLKSKTWAQVAKWHNRSLTKHWFDYTDGRGAMALRHKKFPSEWKCEAHTCKEENSEAFAGQHAANSTSFYIFDEASGIPDKIAEVREGGLSDGEPMVFDFGNPTVNSGFFFEQMKGKRREMGWITRQIDSRTVQITNKKLHQQYIDTFGIDSDFVKVRVLGEFPSSGSLQFIPTAWVEDAMSRLMPADDPNAPLLIGVDVARFGNDESVIYPRIGNDARSFYPVPGNGRYRGLDTVALTGKVIEKLRWFQNTLGRRCDGLFVDGGGIGGGVVDQLRALQWNPIEVQFGGKPTDDKVYRFKVDEMYGDMRDAMQHRLILPEGNEAGSGDLKSQLTQREFGYTVLGNKINLESKADMKERLGEDASPDVADALALTFAQKIAARKTPAFNALRQSYQQAEHDFNPYGEPDGSSTG